MRRREFITLLGGAAAAWPLAARAQQPGKLPTIGFLGADTPSIAEPMDRRFCAATARTRLDRGSHRRDRVSLGGGTQRALRRDRGRVRPAQGRCHCHGGNRTVLAAKQATSVIPIVFAVAGDPVGTGLVASLARPGGNVTGLSLQPTDLAGKRLELLREVVPGLRRLAILANVGNPAAVLEMGEVQAAARTLGLEVATSKSGERRISRPPSRRSRAARRHFMSCRPAREHQPGSHQHLGAGRATADDARLSGVRRSGRSDVLWTKLPGLVPARRRLLSTRFCAGRSRPTSRSSSRPNSISSSI